MNIATKLQPARPQVGLPTERLSVPEMVARLKQTRNDARMWDLVAQKSCIGSKAERDAGDEAAACDARMDILTTAIRAAIDVALEPLGLTWAQVEELGL